MGEGGKNFLEKLEKFKNSSTNYTSLLLLLLQYDSLSLSLFLGMWMLE